jgi:hypothetical protein
MDLSMLVKQVNDVAQLLLGFNVVRPDRLEGDALKETRLMTEASSFLMR